MEYYYAEDRLVHVTTTDYDTLGRTTRKQAGTVPDEVVTTYDYEGNTERITRQTIAHPSDHARNRSTYFFYDAAGNLARQVEPGLDVSDPTTGTFFRYDANSNRVWLKDPVGNVTTWIYDSLNRVIEQRDPLYWHGTDWNSMTDAELLSHISQPTPFDSAPYAISHVTRYAYDAAGNLAAQIDRNGRYRTFEYDYQGHLLAEVWYDADDDVTPVHEFTFTYDTAGNTRTAVDSNAEYTFTYDTMNRLATLTVEYAWANDLAPFTLSYVYDRMGNVVSVSDGLGVAAASEYDVRNGLSSRWWEGDTVDNVRADFEYTAINLLSRVERWVDSERTTGVASTDYAYDSAGRIREISHINALDEVLAQYDYEIDFAGLLTRESLDHFNDAYDRTANYEYDARGQLLAALYDNAQDDEWYTYDANGNRTGSHLHGNGYEVGPANQLLFDGTFSYDYDSEGNMVSKARVATIEGEVNWTRYEYDFHNRLVKVTQYSKPPTEGGVILHEQSYRYDVFGRRIQVVTDGMEIISVYEGPGDLADEWARFDATGEVIQRFLFADGVDRLIAQWTAGEGTVWTLSDHLGSIRDMIDSEGQIVQHIEYSAFGTPTFSAAVDGMYPYAFTGRIWDGLGGLAFYRARFYESRLGRFASQDPLGFNSGVLNHFAYASNAPTILADPSGNASLMESALQYVKNLPVVVSAHGSRAG